MWAVVNRRLTKQLQAVLSLHPTLYSSQEIIACECRPPSTQCDVPGWSWTLPNPHRGPRTKFLPKHQGKNPSVTWHPRYYIMHGISRSHGGCHVTMESPAWLSPNLSLVAGELMHMYPQTTVTRVKQCICTVVCRAGYSPSLSYYILLV